MNDSKEEIAALVQAIARECGHERAAVCAVDCLLQWRDEQLDETIAAWRRWIIEKRNGDGHTQTERHGAWVPAIPM